MVRLDIEQDANQVRLIPLIGKVLRNQLARVADWFEEGEPIAPPTPVIGDIEAMPDFPDFPPLHAVVTCPVLTPHGDLLTQPGYHPAGLWYQPDPGLVVPPVPAFPTQAQIDEARDWVNDNLLVDFPFVSPCDRAVAWACLLLPFVRPAIDGPTPLHGIEAPARGHGKTLLAQCLMAPALGQRNLEAMTVDCEEPEMRKRITAYLRNSPMAILMDNLGQGRRLQSSSLASVLTARAWTDRILGTSVMVCLPVLCTWILTANNPFFSDELVRRKLRCRLDCRLARPHLRKGFKHPKILAWAQAHRASLLGSILTLVRGWLVAGKPEGDVRLGMYESWCGVIGGILQVAGVEGLRQAIELDQGAETATEQALAPFLRAWWARHGVTPVGAKDLYEIAVASGCLEAVLEVHQSAQQRQRGRSAEQERARQTRLGIALRHLSNQVYAGYQIQPAGTDRSGRQTYCLAVPPDGATG